MYPGNKKRALVTGAGSGFGRALCLALARRGYRVAVTDVNLSGAEETKGMVEQAGGCAETARVDVTRPEDLEEAAARFFSDWGGVDLLINNAGVAVAGRFEELALEDWRWIFDINFWGVVHGCRAFIPRLRAQGGGHIINVASLAGIGSLQLMGPYNTTKAAVISASETLKGELHPDNIGVTVVCPSFFNTNLIDSFRGPDEVRSVARQLVESGKLTAEEVAEATLAAMDKNRLYVVLKDGRMIWRFKRFFPELFFRKVHCGVLSEDPLQKSLELQKKI